MPRRRKYRRKPIEQEKEKPFFSRQQDILLSPKQVHKDVEAYVVQKELEEIKTAVWNKLCQLKMALKYQHPDDPYESQSKALELSNQLLAADIWEVNLIIQSLEGIKNTIQSSRFICGTTISQPYGKQQSVINLGQHFNQLNPERQFYYFLKTVISHTTLPDRYGQPVDRYQSENPNQAWVDYISALCKLLPGQPYLITGSPTNHQPGGETLEEIQEEEENNPPETLVPTNTLNTTEEEQEAQESTAITERSVANTESDGTISNSSTINQIQNENQDKTLKRSGVFKTIKKWLNRDK